MRSFFFPRTLLCSLTSTGRTDASCTWQGECQWVRCTPHIQWWQWVMSTSQSYIIQWWQWVMSVSQILYIYTSLNSDDSESDIIYLTEQWWQWVRYYNIYTSLNSDDIVRYYMLYIYLTEQWWQWVRYYTLYIPPWTVMTVSDVNNNNGNL